MKTADMNFRKSIWIFIAVCIVFLIASISVYIRYDKILHYETDAYLVDHLSDRPYISKILCPNMVDANDYQARPVSHFFENIDAHFFYFSYLMGNPLFISVSSTIMLIFLSLIIWFFSVRYSGLNPCTATLFLTFFLTNPGVFFAGTLYRDAKVAAVFFLTLAIFYSFRFISQESPSRLRDSAVIFILALLACLSDPQGFAFVLLLSGIALIWAFFTKSRNTYVTFASGICASLTYILLSIFILPGLVAGYAGFNTYSSFHLLADNVRSVAINELVGNLGKGFLLYLDTLRFIFGNAPRIAIAAGIIILLIAVFRYARHRVLTGMCLILFIAGICFMESAMITRVPQMTSPEQILSGYYQLPATVLFFIALLLIRSSLPKEMNIPKVVPAVLIAVLICTNIVLIPHHIQRATSCKSFPVLRGYLDATPAIRNELIAISKINPVGPSLPYDAWGASHSKISTIDVDRMLRTTGRIHTEYYIVMSRTVNFLRSKKGLPYYKTWSEPAGRPPRR